MKAQLYCLDLRMEYNLNSSAQISWLSLKLIFCVLSQAVRIVCVCVCKSIIARYIDSFCHFLVQKICGVYQLN